MIRVNLEVITEPRTGLTAWKFSWNDGRFIQARFRIANRAAFPLRGPPFKVRAYDPEVDGQIGERERRMLEFYLNNPELSDEWIF